MLNTNVYLMRRIVAFCYGSTEEIEKTRNSLYSVCKQWRDKFRLHLWVHPTSAYLKSVMMKNKILARALWDYSGDLIKPGIGILRAACVRNMWHHAEKMLLDGNVDMSRGGAYKVLCAAVLGDCTQAVEFLLNDCRIVSFKPCKGQKDVLSVGCQSGRVAIVEKLLKDGRFDPTCDNNYPFLQAVMTQNVELVKCLLQDPRIDPSMQNNFVFFSVIDDDCDAVLELFLKDPRVDPSEDENLAVIMASGEGKLSALECLLKHPKVDPGDQDNLAIEMASETDILPSLIAC